MMSDILVSSQSWEGFADGEMEAREHLSVHELATCDTE